MAGIAGMDMPIGERPTWGGERRPFGKLDGKGVYSFQDEDRRVSAYWLWLDANPPIPVDSRTLVDFGRIRVAQLEDSQAADWEALHMRHSIGYSWDHYSGQGDIVSFRVTETDVPLFTAMVQDGVVIHARGYDNEPLTPRRLVLLDAACARMGWTRLTLGRL